jgi:hypothetical protein
MKRLVLISNYTSASLELNEYGGVVMKNKSGESIVPFYDVISDFEKHCHPFKVFRIEIVEDRKTVLKIR